MIARLLIRDLSQLLPGGQITGARGGSMLPLLFFLAVAMLYPFAVGPDAPLLAKTGGGVIWVAALLASILPLDRLVERRVIENAGRQADVFGQVDDPDPVRNLVAKDARRGMHRCGRV